MPGRERIPELRFLLARISLDIMDYECSLGGEAYGCSPSL